MSEGVRAWRWGQCVTGLNRVGPTGHGEDVGFCSENPWVVSEQRWDRIRLEFEHPPPRQAAQCKWAAARDAAGRPVRRVLQQSWREMKEWGWGSRGRGCGCSDSGSALKVEPTGQELDVEGGKEDMKGDRQTLRWPLR